MRGVSRSLLACAAVALLALGLTACGGGDSGDSTASSTPSAESPAETGGNASGEGSAGFITPGGDNSIQNFGEEASDSELEAANVVLGGYLEARANADWKGACDGLAAATVAPLEQLAARTPQFKGSGCAAILATLLSRESASNRVNTMTEGLASLRVEDERSFALYHGPKGVDYFVPMVKEDGTWKVAALTPSEFP